MNATQYNRINELLAEFSTINAAFESAEAEIKTLQLAAAKEMLPKHAELKIKLTDIEAELRKLSDAHYAELFPEDKKRSHATPFGGLKYTKSSSLEADDEEKSVLKIKIACTDELARVGRVTPCAPPRFTQADLIRSREELNLEALEKLDDLTLAAFGIRRVTKDNFKVLPFDMASDKPAKKKNGKQQEAA